MTLKTRRDFLKAAGLGAAAAALTRRAAGAPGLEIREAGPAPAYELGLASYSFRAFGLQAALDMTRRLGLKRISFKSMHLPLESTPAEIEAIIGKTREAGLDPYAAGVIYLNTEPEVIQAFEYARAAGIGLIVGVPAHGLLGAVEREVRRSGIKLAVHNHGPSDKLYPTPESVHARVRNLDARIGLCLDVGHTRRSGLDPAAEADRFFDRLLDVHIKDVTAASAAGSTVEAGRGVVDLPRFLRTLARRGYRGTVSLEYEKDEKDPLPGAAESIGYLRGILAVLGPVRP